MSGAKYSLDLIENGKGRLEYYEELLIRRDQLIRECGSYMTAFTQEFGEIITANFELKVECIKKKKTISYCRRRMNRGLAINSARMQDEIEQEMTLYYTQLNDMLRDTERAKKAGTISEFRLSRSKKIYRRLAKMLHPDINRKTGEDEALKELWERIAEAYQRSDVDALEDLEVLARRAMEDLGDAAVKIELDDIEERIERVEKQINDILTTEPYTYGELLRDEKKKQAYREQLQEEHDDYQQYLESLSRTLDQMLYEGGVKVVWKMN